MQPPDISLPARSGSVSIVSGFQFSFSEANQVLQEYMITMVPQFPFVPLPSHDAYEMFKDKPFLLKTILWVCRPPGPDASAAFESWFRQNVAHQTVVLMNKSLDVVQAILVFLAWKDIYFYAAAKDTSLLQLAVGLVEDLGLNKPQSLTANSTLGSIVEEAAQLRNDLPPQPRQTGDSHRAALGVYYMSSTLFSLLGKRSRLEYAPHFDNFCTQIMREQEYPTDTLLVNLVRIQRIAVKVHDTFRDMIEVTNDRPFQDVDSIAVASIRNELDVLMQQLPDSLKWNHLLQMLSAAVRIRLYESCKSGDKDGKLGPTHLRRRMMWDCLESAKVLCDGFCLVPVESFPFLTCVPILQLALAIIKALRLLCVEDYAWDVETARTTYDLPGALQHLNKLFETASGLRSPRCCTLLHGRPVFSQYSEAYRDIERWYLSKLNPNVAHSDSVSEQPATVLHAAQYEGLEFWTQLEDLTYGLTP
ncbi:fungal transcriptional regulatory protein [Fonsecaea pedrosoi]|nr:fungal transcriptional regulatory protein [Fonsecaea pedrosoi]